MLEKVKKILLDYTEVPASEITLKTDLVKDLDLNSLDVVNIVVAFEDEFEIEIPDQVISTLTKVEDIVKYLEEHV
ncbi:MAG: acyl carrier protein [Lachnospiraceae bacterium]|nr:acyl carrier protein [Lachnospiraceae bacterium]